MLVHLHALGREGFRPGQEMVSLHLLAARDVLAVRLTGSGKSLAYQLTVQYHPGVTIVVSPPIALIRYQVGAVEAHGLDVGAANTPSPEEEVGETLRDALRSQLDLMRGYAEPAEGRRS